MVCVNFQFYNSPQLTELLSYRRHASRSIFRHAPIATQLWSVLTETFKGSSCGIHASFGCLPTANSRDVGETPVQDSQRRFPWLSQSNHTMSVYLQRSALCQFLVCTLSISIIEVID